MLLELAPSEAQLLRDVLQMHLEGLEDTKEQMLQDRHTLSDLDTFTSTFAIHDENQAVIASIVRRIDSNSDDDMDLVEDKGQNRDN